MKDFNMIVSCEQIAESDKDLHYFVVAGNDSVCSSSCSENVNVLAHMFAMVFEEDSRILQAAIKGLAILEGVDGGEEADTV